MHYVLQRGAFPLNPTPDGLTFVALNYELPMSWQLKEVDGILHKSTDDIIAVEMSSSSDFENKVTYTEGMEQLQRWLPAINLLLVNNLLQNKKKGEDLYYISFIHLQTSIATT